MRESVFLGAMPVPNFIEIGSVVAELQKERKDFLSYLYFAKINQASTAEQVHGSGLSGSPVSGKNFPTSGGFQSKL